MYSFVVARVVLQAVDVICKECVVHWPDPGPGLRDSLIFGWEKAVMSSAG
jgi:hypothetical protein